MTRGGKDRGTEEEGQGDGRKDKRTKKEGQEDRGRITRGQRKKDKT
jgi:hypothetical protein